MTMFDNDDPDEDESMDDGDNGMTYPWFQRPAPSVCFTFGVAAMFAMVTALLYRARVLALREKFGNENFRGRIRATALVSAYMDNYGFPRFATVRLCTKSLFFLACLQLDFHTGFWIMWTVLVLESSLDALRILLAYHDCQSLTEEASAVVSDEEVHDMKSTTTLDPTNVYEDLTRPDSIGAMVFTVQALLIGLVMLDTYSDKTRTCFDGNGTNGCPMLGSMGSYCLYLMGLFMASVFYIGPNNAYGQKELNPTYWLKLFLMSKSRSSALTWTDPVTDQPHAIQLRQNDWRIWLRFLMSFIINGVGFHFLLHSLPIQIASVSSIIGVVFRAIGMIYLADLDDSTGATMVLVPEKNVETSTVGEQDVQSNGKYGTSQKVSIEEDFESFKHKVVADAMQDIQVKLEAFVGTTTQPPSFSGTKHRMVSITNALYMSTSIEKRKRAANKGGSLDEETPLFQ
eukprot:scaffold44540_cov229-Amphora_coffeaeformis.AAC.1